MEADSDDSRSAVDFNQSDAELSNPEGMEFKDDHFVYIPSEESKSPPILSNAYQQPHSPQNLNESYQELLQNCEKSNLFSKKVTDEQNKNLFEHWRDGRRCPVPQNREEQLSNQQQRQTWEEAWHRQPPTNWQVSPKTPSSKADSGSDSDYPPAGVRYFVPIGNKVGNNSRASDLYINPPPIETPSASTSYDVTHSQETGMFQFEENGNNNNNFIGWHRPDLEAPSTSARSNHDARSVVYSTQREKIHLEEDGNGNEPDMNIQTSDSLSSWEVKRKTDFMQTNETRLKKNCDENDDSTYYTPGVETALASGLSRQALQPKSGCDEPRQTQLKENYSSNEGEKSTSSGSTDNTYRHRTTTKDAHNSALMLKKRPRCPLLTKRRTKKLVTCFGNLNKAVQTNRPHVKPHRVQILRNSAGFIVKMRQRLAEQNEMIAILEQQNQAYEAEIRKLQDLQGVPEAERIDFSQYGSVLRRSKAAMEQAPLEDVPARETPNSSDMSSNEAYQPTPETSELSSDGAESNR